MSPVQAPSLSRPFAPAPKPRRSPWPAALALAVVVLLAGSFLGLRPWWQRLQVLPDIVGYEVSRQAVEQELKLLTALTEEYAQLTATDRKRLDLALPTKPDIPNLLAQFEGIAQATGFTINDLNFAATAAEPAGALAEGTNFVGEAGVGLPPEVGVAELRVNIVIEGGEYPDLKEFIAAAQESVRLLQLVSVNFTSRETGRSGVTYTLNFRTSYLAR